MNTSLYGGLIEISPDGQPIAPDLVLAYRGGTKQGIIHNVQSLTNKNDLAQAAEITFDVYKKVDNVTCELWNDIRDFRLIHILTQHLLIRGMNFPLKQMRMMLL